MLPEDVLGAPPPDGRPVRIVIVSDTHGYEAHSATARRRRLIHGGDFQMDGGGAKASQEAFDRWLAAQPHAVKIVVRGNHDDHNAKFGRSGARFVARRPALLRVCGLRVLVMPFSRRRGAHTRSPMPGCDVLLTHSPPKFLLDKCYNGENAGSTTIRHAVEQSLAPPQLWICGHVHEARGHAYLESAVGAPKTLVLNAANANVGRASHLVAAPCVADVLPRVADAADASGGAEQRLLAVGAGLRTGAALYDGKGALLKYERLKCGSRAEMRKAAAAWLAGGVTHLALSGDDHPVRREWEAAAAEAASPAAVLTVGRENWEAELLEAKERKGKQARAATSLVARQLVADLSEASEEEEAGGGGGARKKKLDPEAAEAVVAGYYAVRRLGWSKREPAVRRFSNGAVMSAAAATEEEAEAEGVVLSRRALGKKIVFVDVGDGESASVQALLKPAGSGRIANEGLDAPLEKHTIALGARVVLRVTVRPSQSGTPLLVARTARLVAAAPSKHGVRTVVDAVRERRLSAAAAAEALGASIDEVDVLQAGGEAEAPVVRQLRERAPGGTMKLPTGRRAVGGGREPSSDRCGGEAAAADVEAVGRARGGGGARRRRGARVAEARGGGGAAAGGARGGARRGGARASTTT